MPQEKIIIKFIPDGHERLIKAINRLNVSTKKLTGSTATVTAATKGSTVATKQAAMATGVLDTRNKRLAKTNGMVANAFATLRSKLLLVSFAYMLVGRQIAEMVKKFTIQQDAERALESALGRTSQALLDFASAQQKVTTFGDESIIQAMTVIGAYTDEEDQIKALTEASLDLATAKGMDLVAAADMLTKSVFSTTNALQRYGVTVRGMVGSTGRLESATSSISALFGGRAADAADTLSGSFKQLSNSMGDFAENIVESSPVTQGTFILTKALTDLFDTINKSESFFDAFTKSMIRTALGNSKWLLAMFEAANMLGILDTEVDLSTDSTEKHRIKLLEVMEANNKWTISALNLMNVKIGMSDIDQKLEALQSRKLQLIALEAEGLINLISLNTQLNNIDAQMFKLKEQGELKLSLTKKKTTADAIKSGAALIAINSKNVKHAARLQAAAGMIDAWAAAQSQFAQVSKVAPPPFPQIAYIAALAQGVAQAQQITKAAGTAIFETGGLIGGRRHSQGGTMIEAEQGEFVMSRSAVQSVGIENLNRMNEGGGGSAVTVNVSGNVLTEDFVSGELAENIKEAIRRGTDFGIS